MLSYTLILWIKSFHIIFMTAWFAGLFYLPRIFVYHAGLTPADQKTHDLFCTMERRLFWGIMTPSVILTLFLGIGLVHGMKLSFAHPPFWLAFKLFLVGLVVLYHLHCGVLIKKFKQGKNKHGTRFYRLYNEITILMLIGIVLLVILKPMRY